MRKELQKNIDNSIAKSLDNNSPEHDIPPHELLKHINPEFDEFFY